MLIRKIIRENGHWLGFFLFQELFVTLERHPQDESNSQNRANFDELRRLGRTSIRIFRKIGPVWPDLTEKRSMTEFFNCLFIVEETLFIFEKGWHLPLG